MTAHRLTAFTAAVLAVTALGGCASNSTDLPDWGGPRLTGAPGVAKSPEQQATEAATGALNRYYEILSRVLTGADPAELDTVVAGDYRGQLDREIHSLRIPDAVITGQVRAAATTPAKVVAPQDARKAPTPGEAQVELRVCEDRSRLTATGVPAEATLPPTRLRRFLLINRSWPGPGWQVERQYVPFPQTGCDQQY